MSMKVKKRENSDQKSLDISWFNAEKTGLPHMMGLVRKGQSKERPFLLVKGYFAPWFFIDRCLKISISQAPQLLDEEYAKFNQMTEIKEFIRQNRDLLLEYWEDNQGAERLVEKMYIPNPC